MKIKIVTGKIQTGKTTRLFTFTHSKSSIDGILAPIVNGNRKLYHISSRTIKELEVEDANPSTIQVGKFHFLEKSFEWANDKLIESFSLKPEWLIIDELGKLELMGKGLHKATIEILKGKDNSHINLILVIRESLLHDLLAHYKIDQSDIEIMDL